MSLTVGTDSTKKKKIINCLLTEIERFTSLIVHVEMNIS